MLVSPLLATLSLILAFIWFYGFLFVSYYFFKLFDEKLGYSLSFSFMITEFFPHILLKRISSAARNSFFLELKLDDWKCYSKIFSYFVLVEETKSNFLACSNPFLLLLKFLDWFEHTILFSVFLFMTVDADWWCLCLLIYLDNYLGLNVA